jgi:hypothetical protein
MFGKVMVGQPPPPMVIEYDFAALAHEPKPVAVTLKLNVPLVVGVPLKTPVEVFRFSPGGRLPAETAKV